MTTAELIQQLRDPASLQSIGTKDAMKFNELFAFAGLRRAGGLDI